MIGVDDCRLIEFPKISDPRGNLSFVEGGRHLPFEVRRVFYIYDVPTGQSRGAHAHRRLQQCLVCLAGGFTVHLDDGRRERDVRMDRPWMGLLVPPGIWACEQNFDGGSLCLAMVSDHYDESDYIRDYEEFLRLSRKNS